MTSFNYKETTKNRYKDREIASQYAQEYLGSFKFKRLRHKYIAYREMLLVELLIKKLRKGNLGRVLDIPAGTGKLSLILSKYAEYIYAADISDEMLLIAKSEYYKSIDKEKVEFVVCDAEKLQSTTDIPNVDLVICLRLMHRVPSDVRKNMLSSFSGLSENLIVSYGIDSRYHRIRRYIRRFFVGNKDPYSSQLTPIRDIKNELKLFYEVQEVKYINKLLSNEVLIKCKKL